MDSTPADPTPQAATRGPGWTEMRAFLARVAVGPSGSRDLDRAEARRALELCLRREASDVQIAVFLIAERLKRETLDENLGFLDALVAASTVVYGPAPVVCSVADPHDGFVRTPHYGPVIAAVLAACGLPAYVHGVRTLAPKHGITARQVLEHRGVALGVGSPDAVRAAAQRLAERGIAYVDVEDSCPALAALMPLREEIAKRPFLATIDKLTTPLRGRPRGEGGATHVVSGWVHSGYDETMAALLADQGIDSLLLIKGREGHVDPHVHRDTQTAGFRRDPEGSAVATEVVLRPKSYGLLLSDAEEATPTPLDVAAVSDLWDEAVHRKKRTAPGQTVRLAAGTILAQTGHASTIMRGVGMAHQAIWSGKARELLNEGFKVTA